jgi:hypothetical protein
MVGRHSGKGASRRQSGEVPLDREQAPARFGPFGYGPAGPTTLNALVCTPAGMLPDTPPDTSPTLPSGLAKSMGRRDRIVAGSTTPSTGTSLPVKATKGTTRWSTAPLVAGGSPPAKAAKGASATRLANRNFVTVNLLAAASGGMRDGIFAEPDRRSLYTSAVPSSPLSNAGRFERGVNRTKETWHGSVRHHPHPIVSGGWETWLSAWPAAWCASRLTQVILMASCRCRTICATPSSQAAGRS